MSFRLSLAVLLSTLAAAPLTVQTKAEYDGPKAVEDRSKRFLELIGKTTDEQWNARGPGIRHTIGEEAEHIALSENGLQQVIPGAWRSPEQPTPLRPLLAVSSGA
jgi:hypothetical protein